MADGISETEQAFLEAKYIEKPKKSPFIDGTDIPDFIRDKIRAEVEDEFYRYSELIKSDNIPIKKINVYINNALAKPYFDELILKYGIPGTVIVITP